MSIKKELSYWEKNFKEHGLKANVYKKYLHYIKILLENEVPVIFEFKHLCQLLGRSEEFLASLIASSDSFYREFKLKKRSGGYRIIRAPYPSLMECQEWVYNHILKKYLFIKLHMDSHRRNPLLQTLKYM